MKKDGDDWIIYNNEWKDYWKNKKNEEYDYDFINYEDKGFILIYNYKKKGYVRDDIKIYIKYTYVQRKHRKKGILKKMMGILFDKYKYQKISLLSQNPTTDKVWEKFNFKFIYKELYGGCYHYIYE